MTFPTQREYKHHLNDQEAFKHMYEHFPLRAFQIQPLDKIHILHFMGKVFCVEFLTHTC